MEVIFARNVNDAYSRGINLLLADGRLQPSRAGNVLVYPTPVTTVYSNPMERVLFDTKRDANPFFHLFEALWMLAGRNDGVWLDQFVKDFSERFGEKGGTIHGAYGHRWRQALGFDQLDVIVNKLKTNFDDRQAVLQMWDAVPNRGLSRYARQGAGYQGQDDLQGNWKDRPCNTQVYFRVRSEADPTGDTITKPSLDITVCCRSNDAVWGAYGANAVHFSVLQEYLAARIGVAVGRYYQISNNFHIYENMVDKIGYPEIQQPYANLLAEPMVMWPAEFDNDLRTFMTWTSWEASHSIEAFGGPDEYANPWFSNTAEPLFAAAKRWRKKQRGAALKIVSDSSFEMAPDWRAAASAWMTRRMVKTKEGV